jgi:microcystin-dependent protein
VHQGNGGVVAQAGGAEQVTLTHHRSRRTLTLHMRRRRTHAGQRPALVHWPHPGHQLYHVAAPNATMAPAAVASAGG